MRKLTAYISALLISTALYGAVPQHEITVDTQLPNEQWEIKYIYQGATPLIRVNLNVNGTNWYPSSDWSGFLWYGTNTDWASTSIVRVAGVFATNKYYVDCQATNSTFASNGLFYGGFVMSNTTQKIEWGRGRIYVTSSGGIGGVNSLSFTNGAYYEHITATGYVHGVDLSMVVTNAGDYATTNAFNAHTQAVGTAVHGLGSASTNDSDDFYLASNPNNYITNYQGGLDVLLQQLKDLSGYVSLNWTNRMMYNGNGYKSVDWQNNYLYTGTPDDLAVSWGSRTLNGQWDIDTDASNTTDAVNYQTMTNKIVHVDGFTNAPATWSDTWKTPELTMIDGTTLQLGQEQCTVVRNQSGYTITNGKVCKVVFGNGVYAGVELADPTDTWIDSLATIGLATQDITNNNIGKITILGNVNGIDTTAYEEGSNLWLSATTAGELTMAMPTDTTKHQPLIGVCLRKTAGDGRILVEVQKTPHADDVGALPISGGTVTGNVTMVRAYKSDTNSPIDSEYMTKNDVSLAIAGISGTKVFGATNAHPVLSGAASFYADLPAVAWTNTYSVPANGLYPIGNRIMTNVTAGVVAGAYVHHVHANVNASGTVGYYYSVLALFTYNGATTTTNILGTGANIYPTTVIGAEDSTIYLTTNVSVVAGTTNYLGVLRYFQRTGGNAGSTVSIYGGNGYDTGLSMPSTSFDSVDTTGLLKLDGSRAMSGNLNMGGQSITNAVSYAFGATSGATNMTFKPVAYTLNSTNYYGVEWTVYTNASNISTTRYPIVVLP